MELGLLIVAVVLGGLALAAVIVGSIAEVIEAHDINEHGWVRGHHRRHGLRHGV